ncbi:MAG: hypothetical protein EKK46_15030 [Rhodocyclaceae bacterium]|nr:MAG: hypothetical protein EKK46_15030 [Rhodocyclaceae bacterium]
MSNYKIVKAQISKLEKQAEELLKKEVKEVIQTIKGYIQEYNLTAKDLGLKSARATKSKAARSSPVAKYQDPKSGKTWSGVGKPPLWISAAVKAGKKDDYLIGKTVAAPARKKAPTKAHLVAVKTNGKKPPATAKKTSSPKSTVKPAVKKTAKKPAVKKTLTKKPSAATSAAA